MVTRRANIGHQRTEKFHVWLVFRNIRKVYYHLHFIPQCSNHKIDVECYVNTKPSN